MCICMNLISLFVVAIFTVQLFCPYNCCYNKNWAVVLIYIESKSKGEYNINSFIEVTMIYV